MQYIIANCGEGPKYRVNHETLSQYSGWHDRNYEPVLHKYKQVRDKYIKKKMEG
jgi:hypothetical protein